eukprot:2476496-Amphidinium_carterae.1
MRVRLPATSSVIVHHFASNICSRAFLARALERQASQEDPVASSSKGLVVCERESMNKVIESWNDVFLHFLFPDEA